MNYELETLVTHCVCLCVKFIDVFNNIQFKMAAWPTFLAKHFKFHMYILNANVRKHSAFQGWKSYFIIVFTILLFLHWHICMGDMVSGTYLLCLYPQDCAQLVAAL